MSFVFLRDDHSIKLLNTQTWLVSELVELGEGLNFPDLQLFEVIQEGDNQISVFTVKGKNNGTLVKRTYSHLLKYCLQTASIKASASSHDPDRGLKKITEMQRQQTMAVARQTTPIGKVMQ